MAVQLDARGGAAAAAGDECRARARAEVGAPDRAARDGTDVEGRPPTDLEPLRTESGRELDDMWKRVRFVKTCLRASCEDRTDGDQRRSTRNETKHAKPPVVSIARGGY